MPKLLAITALVAAVVGPTVAAGATNGPSQVVAYGPGWHGEPGGVGISGGTASNQVVVRSPGPSAVVVSDKAGAIAEQRCQEGFPQGPITVDCGCEQIDARSVACHTPYGMKIGAGLMAGDDTIRVLDPLSLTATSGRGADRLTGNARGDFLRSDEGPDLLSGRQGKDELFSGPGHDSVYGGAGNDLLWVHDEDRDRVIDCGRGNDRVFVDRKLDPKPLRCEHVHFARARG